MILSKIYREEWDGLVEEAEHNLNSDCPLIEDETIIKVDDYIEYLESTLKKKAEQLEAQIEDMKCCGNCKHVDIHLCSLLGESITPEFCCAKWELLE